MDQRDETDNDAFMWQGRQTSSHTWSNDYVSPYGTLPQIPTTTSTVYTGQTTNAIYNGTYQPYQPSQLAFNDSLYQLSYTHPELQGDPQIPFSAAEDYGS